jgi:hypothetical protein
MSKFSTGWAKYEPEIAAFAKKVDQVLLMVEHNKRLVEILKAVPEGAKILAALGATESTLAIIGDTLPMICGLVALYETYKQLGGRPMDANDIAKIDYDKTKDMP